MLLIMSSAYIEQELKSELGKIPPSFLPLGNRRLFQHQVKLAPQNVSIYLSIPDSYRISAIDEKWLSDHSVHILRIPENLSIGAALVAALNLADHSLDTPLHVLYGDTLFDSLPEGDDIIGITEVKDSYNWAVVTNNKSQWVQNSDLGLDVDTNNVVSGYFKFSQPRQLIKCITQSSWDYIEGLNRYHSSVALDTIRLDSWLDFGHVNTYYRSKAKFTTQRAFNQLKITSDWIEKSSDKNLKIEAEAHWFETLPKKLRGYIPQYLGTTNNENRVSYKLEYLYHTALNELFVFSETSSSAWKQIIFGCLKFLEDCYKVKKPQSEPANTLEELFGKKTNERIDDFCSDNGISRKQIWQFNNELTVSIDEVLTLSNSYLPKKQFDLSVLHGDFCFSNILYDFRTGRVKTIDPRGITPENQLSIYGDIRYDLAKLSHSILGMYDWIIAGYYDVSIESDSINFRIESSQKHRQIQKIFSDLVLEKFGISILNLYAMQIQLFLSMLPLHSDDPQRQKALFANVFRLYQILQRLEK
ncbi:capsular biosynthesis protein [Vibrio sp. JC009]|uniref:capsular biosynthesis protein n=1 Tax=Vibrio sp. JC009 TaxID=2912314 RepID=UPI0023AF4B8A|nr:capsular biosynthesis protein [Vibrio sp. JC009]WED22014.1 capsular biosynthesis protein [Vibrio sp. JC009]